jgi:hypothetical protein
LGQEGDDVREPLYYSLSAELEGKDSAADEVIFYIPVGNHKVSED